VNSIPVTKIVGAMTTTLLVGLVAWIGCDLVVRGAGGFYPGYLFENPVDLGRAGGIGPVLVSTLVIVSLAVALAAVVSLPCAIVYVELLGSNWLRSVYQALLDMGLGVPRIVWGLFGGVVFGGMLGFGFSILTGVITLACLLAPILTTGFIAGLRAVDPALRVQSAALGVSSWRTFWTQVLPAARPALGAATALGVARGCGDAAALLFTAGVTAELPGSLFDPGATLAVFVLHLLSTVPGGQRAAYTAAAVLFCLTFSVQVGIACTNRKGRFAR
jgi:phosphate transport system permease protein